MADQSKKTGQPDGKHAAFDYEATMTATRAKTERLRALRLARDAAAPPPPPKPAARKKKAGMVEKRSAGTLGQWLEDQQKSGRNS